MATSERGTRPETLADVLNDERNTSAAGSRLPARGQNITADNTRAPALPDTRPLAGEGRHRER